MKLLFSFICMSFSFLSIAQISIKGASDVASGKEKVTFERKEVNFTNVQIEQAPKQKFVVGNKDGVKYEIGESIKVVLDSEKNDLTIPSDKNQIIIGLGEPTVTNNNKSLASTEENVVTQTNIQKATNTEKTIFNEQPNLTKPKMSSDISKPTNVPIVVDKSKHSKNKKSYNETLPSAPIATTEVSSSTSLKKFAIEEILIHDILGLIFFDRFALEYKDFYSQELQKISDYLIRNPKARVSINSYVTSEAARDNFKPTLANARANKVLEVLTKNYGVDIKKLDVVIIDKHQNDDSLRGCITFTVLK